MPGLVDTHIHAPQYTFTGTGYDCGVVEWLMKYTFPIEAKFKDTNFAHNAYRKVVVRNLSHYIVMEPYFYLLPCQLPLTACSEFLTDFSQPSINFLDF